jgi:hypothetical protein
MDGTKGPKGTTLRTRPGDNGFLFSSRISNAPRLPNGNTLINEGLDGRFFQVAADGDVVWEYVNPNFGPTSAPPKDQTNNVFRAYRYSAGEIAAAQKIGWSEQLWRSLRGLTSK